MEYDILNEIITNTVGGLFRKMPTFQPGLREASSWINKSQQQQQLPQQQQMSRTGTSVRHEKKRSSGDFSSGSIFSKEESPLFTSLDTSLSVQKSVDYSHAKSRSIDNTFDKKTAGSVNSLASLNTSSSSLQPIKNEQDTKLGYSTTNISNNNGQYIKQNNLMKNEPPSMPSFDKWIRKDGPLKLQEALINLKLDLKSVNKANLSSLTYDQLCAEKKNVKNELKAYDAYFAATFKRAPEREEKEPMRPLYIYYKKIKQYMIKNIEKAKANKAASVTQSNVTQAGLAGGDKGGRTLKTNKMLTNEKENKLIGHTGMYERKLETSFETQLSKDRGFFNIGEDRGDFNEKNLRQMGAKGNMQMGGMSQDQIRRQLEEYKAVRVQLREKLHSYQTDFTRNNNRKIKYHRDIAPVENEYKRYKDIKQEINRLEGLMNSWQ